MNETCESCGNPADVMLDDRSFWCNPCDASARNLGYDNRPSVHLNRVAPD